MTLKDPTLTDEPQKGKAASECDLPTHLLVEETLQTLHQHLFVDPPEIQQHVSDICSELTSEAADVEREVVEVEMCPTATGPERWDLRRPESFHDDDQKYNSQAAVRLSLNIVHIIHFFGKCRQSAVFCCKGWSWPCRSGIHTDGEEESQRASLCNGERKNNAQPGGHAKKSGTEAAERSRKTAAEGEQSAEE